MGMTTIKHYHHLYKYHYDWYQKQSVEQSYEMPIAAVAVH